ncbi:MAG TPA: DUF3617 domain-containing protein [Sphingomicrobium sp.]|nr:DUF3617 domain-containing protein [Sphingomicrobium sp.]
MKRAAFLIFCLIPLGACSKGPEVHERNASVEQVANAVSASAAANELFLKAGEWKVEGTLEEMIVPGLSPEAQSQMKEVMGRRGNSSYQYCLTPEQAKKPGGRFFNRQADRNCRYDHFTMRGGKIDAVMRCAAPSGSMEMTIEGTYSPDSDSTHVAMNMEGGQKMTMKMRSEAHRIGECTPEDSARAEAESGTKG